MSTRTVFLWCAVVDLDLMHGCGSGSHADVRDPSRALCGDVCHVWILVSCVDRARQRVDLEEGRACAGMLPVLV